MFLSIHDVHAVASKMIQPMQAKSNYVLRLVFSVDTHAS